MISPLLTPEQLHVITGKKRAHYQWAWFNSTFGVDLPCNTKCVIISPQLFEQLQARRAGLIALTNGGDRPKIYT